MLYRSFKGTNISEVGLGTWQLGSSDWGNVNEEDAFAILQAFADKGGNFIDTADVYGNGLSEQVIGKFLGIAQKEMYVGTKLGRRSDMPFGMPQNFTYDLMRRQVESSLENLGLQQLFLEQLHCIPTEQLKKGDVFDQLRKLSDEGLIRYWGVSVETTEEALICLEQAGLSSLQIIFNLFRQHVAEELFAKAREKDVALIIRVPLASGLLAGKFKKNSRFSEKDHRYYNAGGKVFNAGETFAGLEFATGLELSEEIAALMPDTHTAQWAIRWILDHPEVSTVIPGASKPAQVETNMAASGFPPISKLSHQQLRLLYDEKIRNEIKGHY